MHEVQGLIRVQSCEPRPTNPAQNIFARRGLAYQRKLGQALVALASKIGGQVELEPWFRFWDASGQHKCSPDALFHFQDKTLIIEAKLTWVPEAWDQLLKLYMPVVMLHQSHLRIYPLIICKNLTPDSLCGVETLSEAFYHKNGVPCLNWLGRGPLHFTFPTRGRSHVSA